MGRRASFGKSASLVFHLQFRLHSPLYARDIGLSINFTSLENFGPTKILSSHILSFLTVYFGIGRINRGQLSSRQGSSNNSDGNNRESSLDDSGVVDDHEEADGTSEDVANLHFPPQALVQVLFRKYEIK